MYFSPEMGTLLKGYRRYCETEALHYEGRTMTDNDFLFRKHELDEPTNGTDVATVSSLFGHAQVSTTLDIYTHAFDKNKKAASDKLHNALEI